MTTLPRGHDGDEYGTADQIAAVLTSPERTITADRIRDWARRSRNPKDRLYGMLPRIHAPGARTGTTWYRLDHAAAVEQITGQIRALQCDHTLTRQVNSARNPVDPTARHSAGLPRIRGR